MKAFQDTDQVRSGLKEAITLLCKTGLVFQSEMSIDGLLGITLDHNEVFLVSIQEVIKNPRDFAVTSSGYSQSELTDAGLYRSHGTERQTAHSKIVSLSKMSKRSRRKRSLIKAHQPQIRMDASRPSSVDTEDGLHICEEEEEEGDMVQAKKHKPNHSEANSYEDNDISNEPLSLVVRKSPCDSKGLAASDSHSDTVAVPDNDEDIYPTDLRVKPDTFRHNEIQMDTISQKHSINHPPFAENCDDTQQTQKEMPEAKPDSKPKANHRKSKSKPKRILPGDWTSYNENYNNQSISSPSGSPSPSCPPSQRSTPDDREPDPQQLIDSNVTPESQAVDYSPGDSFSVSSDKGFSAKATSSFTNVYESGTPTSSPLAVPSSPLALTVSSSALTLPKKETFDPNEKLFENLLPGAAGNPWSMVFDPDSHSKWLQSIAAYVQTPLNPAMVPPMAHQRLPFVGGALPSPKLPLPPLSKPQVSTFSYLPMCSLNFCSKEFFLYICMYFHSKVT